MPQTVEHLGILQLLASILTVKLITGVVTGTADALAARVTKTAVSAALPVVGSILSDAASTLAAAAGTLKATIGIFGLLAEAAICLPPVLTLGVRFFVYKLTAAVCECVADKRFSELISNLGTAFALLLAINGVSGTKFERFADAKTLVPGARARASKLGRWA